MIGAIIGDIVGSRFEFHNIKSKDFDLFTSDCFFTDDSVMSLAVAEAIMESDGDYELLSRKIVVSMQKYGRLYPHAGYGRYFKKWLELDYPMPYNSFGNGAAMRVSACGFAGKSIEDVRHLSYNVTYVTHNHYEGIRGAEATAVAVYLAKTGKSKQEIRDYITEHYYSLDFTLDELRKTYGFQGSCQGTVPPALAAFFEAEDFEDAIRNAISIGGDSDTIGAITGAVAEAYFGVPDHLRTEALKYLDTQLRTTLNRFEGNYM